MRLEVDYYKKFRLPSKFKTKQDILDCSGRYNYRESIKESRLMKAARRAKHRGYFTKKEFVELCEWKTPRQRSNYKRNESQMIENVSKIAFGKNCPEKLRILIFTLLEGVKMRVASALLHMAYLESGVEVGYPIMDFRALNTLGCSMKKDSDPRYEDTDFWLAYTKFCRRKAKQYNIGLRELDRALWQHNKEKSRSERHRKI